MNFFTTQSTIIAAMIYNGSNFSDIKSECESFSPGSTASFAPNPVLGTMIFVDYLGHPQMLHPNDAIEAIYRMGTLPVTYSNYVESGGTFTGWSLLPAPVITVDKLVGCNNPTFLVS